MFEPYDKEDKMQQFSDMYWNICMKGYKDFTDLKIKKLSNTSLTVTKKSLIARRDAECQAIELK